MTDKNTELLREAFEHCNHSSHKLGEMEFRVASLESQIDFLDVELKTTNARLAEALGVIKEMREALKDSNDTVALLAYVSPDEWLSKRHLQKEFIRLSPVTSKALTRAEQFMKGEK